MNPPRNMLSRDFGQQPMQDAPPMNMLARGGMGQPPVHMASDRGQGQGQSTQQMLDEAWERMPNDSTGEQIDMIVRQSGGRLTAPWDRKPEQNMVRGAYDRVSPPEDDKVDEIYEQHPNRGLAEWWMNTMDGHSNDRVRDMYRKPLDAVGDVMARRYELRNRR